MFSSIPKDVRFPSLEEEILQFWKSKQIYQKTLDQRRGSPPFVFYEGPPTANGLPHPGHCLTRAMKDLFPRYRTMRGYYCERKAGWDTHGLPVEVEVCKELGIHSKEEIEEFGVEPFIQKCQQSVWRYVQAWESLTERIGFWVNLDEAYATYRKAYVESVWWSLKTLFDRGLLYQGHKIVWWWAQGGTALSSGEVGQGYREVADPSVYVRFPLLDEARTSLLVWTTTPWTLPSNQFAAVHPEIEYAYARDVLTSEQLIVAKDLVDAMAEKGKREFKIERTCRGEDLLGLRYLPPFDIYYRSLGEKQGNLIAGGKQHVAWRVVPADFVTVESGTGLVHEAPAFGEVDFDLLQREQARFCSGEGPELLCAVNPQGQFTDVIPEFAGRWVKDADRDIIRSLKDRGHLFHQEQYLHEYPFCWRSEKDPLIQYPRRSWFIRTSQFKDQMLENNRKISWMPEHIRDGRFGNFLESNVDWALSRERYWGTPLPIWQCEKTGYQEAIGSLQELHDKPGIRGTEVWQETKRKSPELFDDLQVHKPYIDEITYESPKSSTSRMRRVTEVIDCWYDSGAMPFAQWGYPHKNQALFRKQFPADFISEALDQTRGWFYSLVAISTLLFGDTKKSGGSSPGEGEATSPDAEPYPHPFRNCIVLGLMLSEWLETKSGKIFLSEDDARASGEDFKQMVGKMSKSKRNYREPREIFERYGADALRWYFFANQAPWTSIRYSERAIKESIPEFQLRLWNVFSFFVIYAQLDEFNPSESNHKITVSPHDKQQLSTAFLRACPGARPLPRRHELDRWVLSELQKTTAAVIEAMDRYDNFAACGHLNAFVDGLSNWYVRRSRDRFWSEEKQDPDKLDAYWTLYECLLTVAKLTAPFTPFLADYMWRVLTSVYAGSVAESVHLCDYPVADPTALDQALSENMALAREICSKGRAVRMQHKLKVRQPLASVQVILNAKTSNYIPWLREHSPIMADELNVKEVHFTTDAEKYITYEVKPNFKALGPRVGKAMPEVKQRLIKIDPAVLMESLQSGGGYTMTMDDGSQIRLSTEELEVGIKAREGWAAAQGEGSVVVLSTELTPMLLREGVARDLVRLIQDRRKELDLHYSARIVVAIETSWDELITAVNENQEYIQRETLAVRIEWTIPTGEVGMEHDLGSAAVKLHVRTTT
jgi:isoleucyl-tRNA synthetase